MARKNAKLNYELINGQNAAKHDEQRSAQNDAILDTSEVTNDNDVFNYNNEIPVEKEDAWVHVKR